MEEKIFLNNDWQFTESFSEAFAEGGMTGSDIKSVRLPHTCKEVPFHYFDEHIYQMVSGYRRTLMVPPEWRKKQIFLTFEGVAHQAEVYLNGEKIAEHRCGYTAFTTDIGKKLKYGENNLLAVRVDSRESANIPPFGFVVDYMTYGGIYRDVYLEVRNETCLTDVFVKPEIKTDGGERADAWMQSQITLNQVESGLTVRQTLRRVSDGKNKTVRDEMFSFPEMAVTEKEIQLKYPLKQITLWDVTAPNLYELKTVLCHEGKPVDQKTIRFGFRSAEFRADGFYLNGRKLKLRGMNRHQSYPYVGYAMPAAAQIQDADILKYELGLNAVRTSHYPQSHYFLNRCDEIGLLVFTEIPGWQHIGDAAWKEQAVKNTGDMVRQYRNHTSIILWGVRINESGDDDEFYRRTNEVAHRLDDTRATGGVRAHKKSSLLEDVYTYNDFLHDGKAKGCEKKKKVTSDESRPYLVSEYNGHMFPTKSYDCEEHRLEHALRHARVLDAIAVEENIAGSFGWCMFDYNTHKDFGSGDRICYHGVMDMFRNPKMAAAVYASQQEEEPVLVISSSMDIGEHPGCNRGDIYVFTNADSVRMYRNDRFIQEFSAKDSPFSHLKHGPVLLDDFIGDEVLKNENFTKKQAKEISYALNTYARYGAKKIPPKLVWIAIKMMLFHHMKPKDAVTLYNRYVGDWGCSVTTYRFEAIKNGKVVKTVQKEPMQQVKLSVQVDHTALIEGDTYDVASIRIRAEDEKGNVLPFLSEPVFLKTEGPICCIGPEVVPFMGGMTGTYIKTTGEEGEAKLHIRTAQAEEITVTFQVAKR